MMSDGEYARDLAESIEIDRYTTLVQSVGSKLNRPKDRFDKSDIIERCLQVYTDGRLEWVDDEGRDFVDTKYDYDVEFKYEENLLFTEVRENERDPKPRLYNSLGNNNKAELPKPADFYLLGQQDAMAVLSYDVFDDPEKNTTLELTDDAIIGDIDSDEISYLFRPEDIGDVELVDVNYKERKMGMQMDLIDSI